MRAGRRNGGAEVSGGDFCMLCKRTQCECSFSMSRSVMVYGAPSPPSYPGAFPKPPAPMFELKQPDLMPILEALKAQLDALTAKVDALAERPARQRVNSYCRYNDRIDALRKHFGAEVFSASQARDVLKLNGATQTSLTLRRLVARGLLVKKFHGAYQVAS